jgi:hypothetical protein
MAFEEFKNFCPECGERITLMRVANGNFRCPACECEFKRNWRVWLMLGVPAVAWGVFLLGSLPGLRFWEAPLGAVFWSGAVLFAAFWIWGGKEYLIVQHGRELVDSADESNRG